MKGLEESSFEIISHSGQAKTEIMTAIANSRDTVKDPQPLLKDAKEELKKAQNVHLKVISDFAKTGKSNIDPLYMHAEDQMITAETFLDLATELIKTNLEINKLKQGKRNNKD
ncbi:MAG: PTS lactose/cellobiose transporter subunit IIA [Lactobacillus sp.]|nr:PTS lactose/cellobiose transporter subunit IIA [Lactobacillus sp.]